MGPPIYDWLRTAVTLLPNIARDVDNFYTLVLKLNENLSARVPRGVNLMTVGRLSALLAERERLLVELEQTGVRALSEMSGFV